MVILKKGLGGMLLGEQQVNLQRGNGVEHGVRVEGG